MQNPWAAMQPLFMEQENVNEFNYNKENKAIFTTEYVIN